MKKGGVLATFGQNFALFDRFYLVKSYFRGPKTLIFLACGGLQQQNTYKSAAGKKFFAFYPTIRPETLQI